MYFALGASFIFIIRTGEQVPDIKKVTALEGSRKAAYWVCQDPENTKYNSNFIGNVTYPGAKQSKSASFLEVKNDQCALFKKLYLFHIDTAKMCKQKKAV